MNGRQVGLALLFVVVAVLLQTTLFARVRPLDVAADIVLLTVIASVRWLEPEPAVLLGFTGGLLIDLFGSAPLGLQALAFTLVALVTVRTRDRFDFSPVATGVAVGLLSLLGVLLVAVVGTLFGEGTLNDAEVLKSFLLVPIYNLIIGMVVLPLVTLNIGEGRRRSDVFI
jgi:rod shape-determining protein MreD